MDDTAMTPIEHAREIAKAVGDVHTEVLKLRRAGLPAKFNGQITAIEDKLTRLADLNAALSDTVRKAEEPAAAPETVQ